MTFPPKSDNFSGLIKSFYDTGKPNIELNASEPANGGRKAINALNYKDTESHFASNSNDALNAFFIIILSSPFYITHYTIRSHQSSTCHIRAWTFAASKDGNDYKILDNKEANDYLKSSGSVRTRVNPQRKRYKYFRIMQTEANAFDKVMRISGVDLFGSFTLENKRRRKIYFSTIVKFVFIIIVIKID